MLVINNYFSCPFIDFLLTEGLHFSLHIVTTRKDGFEEIFVWKSSHTLYFFDKIRLAIVFWPINFARLLQNWLVHLDMVRNYELIGLWLGWLLRVLIEVLFFVKIVESSLCFPRCLTIILLLKCRFVFIYSGKSKRKKVFCVSVKITTIVSDVLSQLLFLEFPNVQLLRRVLKYFHPWW